MNNPHIGSSFDAFLAEEALLDDATAIAIKRVNAWQIEQKLKVGRAVDVNGREILHLNVVRRRGNSIPRGSR